MVLLAAFPGQDTLAAYLFAVMDRALRARAVRGQGGSGDVTAAPFGVAESPGACQVSALERYGGSAG